MCFQPQIGIKLRIELKIKKLEQIFSKINSFLFQTLICIINYAKPISDDVIQLTSKDALVISLQVLKVSI